MMHIHEQNRRRRRQGIPMKDMRAKEKHIRRQLSDIISLSLSVSNQSS